MGSNLDQAGVVDGQRGSCSASAADWIDTNWHSHAVIVKTVIDLFALAPCFTWPPNISIGMRDLHADFQSAALPTELPGRVRAAY
jgi:hypothetical protein